MGLINWIFDFYQHSKINRAQEDADHLRMEMATLRNTQGGLDNDRLLRAIGELALATKTLQRLMVDKGLCTPGEFQATLDAVDMEDGQRDGRLPTR